MDKDFLKTRLLPFVLTAAIIAADQVTKFLVSAYIPLGTVGFSFGNGLVRIFHVANKGVAFSAGSSLPETARRFLFSIVPLVVIAVVIMVYLRNKVFSRLERWCIAGVIGGGLGNLIDRFFRTEGVVDFVDVKFFGLFGLERWPTFNVADASIVVCGGVLIASFFLSERKAALQERAEKTGMSVRPDGAGGHTGGDN